MDKIISPLSIKNMQDIAERSKDMKVYTGEVKADIAELEGIAGRIEEVYNAAECMFNYGFTYRYFEEPELNNEMNKEMARIQYHILGNEILAISDAVMELKNYIGRLTK